MIKNNLFEPLKIRGVTFKNKFQIPPMCMYSAKDGVANDFHLAHYTIFGRGGFGSIIVEATGVSPEGRISFNDLGLYDDKHILPMKRVVDSVHSLSNNVKIGVQLAHSGRKASTTAPFKGFKTAKPDEPEGWVPVAPSAIKFDSESNLPKELTIKEIEELEEKFVNSSKRAIKSGFDFIQIHAAHGYLINNFLSETSNKRNDKYGGSFENRIRFLTNIVDKVRKVIPKDMPLMVRLSVDELSDDKNAWNVDDTIKLIQILKNKGVDCIDFSPFGGNCPNWRLKMKKPLFQQNHYCEKVLNTIDDIFTCGVGSIDEQNIFQCLNKDGKAKTDFIQIGRGALKNPYIPMIIAEKSKMKSEDLAQLYIIEHGAYLKRAWKRIEQQQNEQKEKQN